MDMTLREIAALALDEWEEEVQGTGEERMVDTSDADPAGGAPNGPAVGGTASVGGAPTNKAAAQLQNNLQQHLDQYHHGQQPKGRCKYMDNLMAQAEALGVADKVPGLEGGGSPGGESSENVKESEGWKQYVTDRQVQDATFKEKLKALGVENPELNGSGYNEEQMKVVDEWHKAIDERRDKYLKDALGDAEAHCVEQLADIIEAGGENAEKALKIAEEISNKYPEGDPRHDGAEKMKDIAERKRQKDEFDKRQAELEAKENELKEREEAIGKKEKENERVGGESRSTEEGSTSSSIGNLGEVKVGNKTYVDLSGKGFWEGMAAAFKAGYEGKDIITDWDKMSGRWDKIRQGMTAEQKSNYDGLSNGLAQYLQEEANKAAASQFEKLLGDESGLTDEQKAYVRQMYADWAKDDKNKSRMLKELNRYLREQGIESGAKASGKNDKTNGTSGFDQLRHQYTGEVPTTDIYEPTPDEEKDTSFMEKIKKGIEDRLTNEGIGAKIVDVKNGPSVIQFEIQRDDNKTSAALAAALRDMQNDLGVTITYEPDRKTGKERTGYIRVNNPKPRDAGIRSLLEKSLNPVKDKDGNEVDNPLKAKIAKMWAPFLAGETADGDPLWIDLRDHGLLGGDSNAGKSERLRGGLVGAYHVKTPNQLQVLVNAHANSPDYEDVETDPHTAKVAKTVDDVMDNLKRGDDEWKRRQELFAQVGARDLDDYNEKMVAAGKEDQQLPELLVVTDELTNLLSQRPDAADYIRGMLTNGRKFGVAHLGATQDPRSSNVPTDLKGANRMGVHSATPTVSDMVFGERVPEMATLEKKGGMLVKTAEGIKRLRGTYANKENARRLVEYNKGAYKKDGSVEVATNHTTSSPSSSPESAGGQTAGQAAPQSVAAQNIGATANQAPVAGGQTISA